MKWYYLQTNGFCIIVLLILLINLRRNHGQRDKREATLLQWLLGVTIVVLAFDGASWMLDGAAGSVQRWGVFVSNTATFFLSGIMGLLWLAYVHERLYQRLPSLRRFLCVWGLPCWGLAAASAATPWTGWLFTIDAQNQYHRGQLYFLQATAICLYMLLAAIVIYRARKSARTRAQKRECRSLMALMAPPAVCMLVQGLYYGVSLVWTGMAVTLLLLFINSQNRQISLDGLTGVNNRGRLNQFLEEKLPEQRRSASIYFFLIDIDSFKSINDQYGHTEGDEALLRVAGVLKRVCAWRNYFLARYGGDEFAIVCELAEQKDVEKLSKEIDREIQMENLHVQKPYQLSCSCGFAKFGEMGADTLADLVALADQRMYTDKGRPGQAEAH